MTFSWLFAQCLFISICLHLTLNIPRLSFFLPLVDWVPFFFVLFFVVARALQSHMLHVGLTSVETIPYKNKSFSMMRISICHAINHPFAVCFLVRAACSLSLSISHVHSYMYTSQDYPVHLITFALSRILNKQQRPKHRSRIFTLLCKWFENGKQLLQIVNDVWRSWLENLNITASPFESAR